MMTERAKLNLSRVWTFVLCPPLGWYAVYAGTAHGQVGTTGALLLLLGVPALLAAAGAALAGRRLGSLLTSGMLAGALSGVGVVLLLAIFLLTVPDGFFN
jgi:hypothetical protein